jgi:4-carboxymuconolactone decarboxylase
MDDRRFDEGLAMRRTVLGDAYVDRALAAVDVHTADLQRLVTEFAWGDVWTRPELSRAQRSLVTLGLLTALNRPHELRVHVQGALHNGLTQEQIVEVVIHSAVYCGFPAALDAMRIVREVFAEQP